MSQIPFQPFCETAKMMLKETSSLFVSKHFFHFIHANQTRKIYKVIFSINQKLDFSFYFLAFFSVVRGFCIEKSNEIAEVPRNSLLIKFGGSFLLFNEKE
jgi:hypothetical protein